MIEVKNISKKFNNNVVLNGIDLNINKGDVVAIIGPSGTGKSTFLRCLNRLEKCYSDCCYAYQFISFHNTFSLFILYSFLCFSSLFFCSLQVTAVFPS